MEKNNPFYIFFEFIGSVATFLLSTNRLHIKEHLKPENQIVHRIAGLIVEALTLIFIIMWLW
jgi:hypothetical protein